MPERQNRRLNLSLRLEQSNWTHARGFENSQSKEVKLLRVESRELKVHWILVQSFTQFPNPMCRHLIYSGTGMCGAFRIPLDV